MKRHVQHRERGFTLLEVIIAIALFALLMGIVYSGFSVAVRAYDAAEQRVGEVERMRVVSAFIRRSVGGAHALAVAVRREWHVQFEGTADRLRYIADLPGYVGIGGVHEVVLELDTNGKQHDLIMRRRPIAFQRSGEIGGAYETRVLSENIEGFELRYFGRMNDSEEPSWRDEWMSASKMPLLVELTIRPTTGPAWPVLQVHTRVNSIRYVSTPNTSAGEAPAEAGSEATPAEVPAAGPGASNDLPGQLSDQPAAQ